MQDEALPGLRAEKRERKVEQIMKNFRGVPIHAALADDADWEAFHKTHVERHGARYHRIPAPEGKSIILTDAEVGEVIDEQDVRVVVELNPSDGRRMTQSREWKEEERESRWSRVGISPLNATQRNQVYVEEGCEPYGAPTAKGLIGAQDVDLPDADSPAMERLKERLKIPPDELRLGEDGGRREYSLPTSPRQPVPHGVTMQHPPPTAPHRKAFGFAPPRPLASQRP